MNKNDFKSLMIEPTNKCNLTCPACPAGTGYYKKRGEMSYAMFKKIINSVKDIINKVNLDGYGEPFLAADIDKMIALLGKYDIHTTIHTNANINLADHIKAFKNNFKITIIFSIDGVTQKSYEKYRVGGDLDRALGNLKQLSAVKRKFKFDNLRIFWQFLVMKHNESEIAKAMSEARKIGVDSFRIKTISIPESHPRFRELSPSNKNIRRRKEHGNCPFISPGSPFVLWNGDIVPCCADYRKMHVMGNCFRDNLKTIWRGRKYENFRNEYYLGKNETCNKYCRFNGRNRIYKEYILADQ